MTGALSDFQVPKIHGFTRYGFISLSLLFTAVHPGPPLLSLDGLRLTSPSSDRPSVPQLGTDSGLGGHRVTPGIQISLGGQGKNHLPPAVPAWRHIQNRHSTNTLGMNRHQPGPETCPLPWLFLMQW